MPRDKMQVLCTERALGAAVTAYTEELLMRHSLLDSLEVKNDLKLVTDIFHSYATLTYFSVWTTCNSISRGEPPTSA